MEKCNDFWCEHYGKGSTNCDNCLKVDKTAHDYNLQVILKRRADKQMKLAENPDKIKGQER